MRDEPTEPGSNPEIGFSNSLIRRRLVPCSNLMSSSFGVGPMARPKTRHCHKANVSYPGLEAFSERRRLRSDSSAMCACPGIRQSMGQDLGIIPIISQCPHPIVGHADKSASYKCRQTVAGLYKMTRCVDGGVIFSTANIHVVDDRIHRCWQATFLTPSPLNRSSMQVQARLLEPF